LGEGLSNVSEMMGRGMIPPLGAWFAVGGNEMEATHRRTLSLPLDKVPNKRRRNAAVPPIELARGGVGDCHFTAPAPTSASELARGPSGLFSGTGVRRSVDEPDGHAFWMHAIGRQIRRYRSE
jgi:hypothetical protein